MHKVRELNVEDMMLASEVIDELVSNISKEDIESIFSGNANAKDIGLSIVKVAVKHARKPAFEFLANVNDMDIDEFKKQPASFITETVQAIRQNEKNKDFFEELRKFLPSA